jgi:hypothetical protein
MQRLISMAIAASFFGFCTLALVVVLFHARSPRALCAESLFDFGMVKVGMPQHHQFVIRNVGQRVLTILDARSGCHCTSVSRSNNSQVEPGASAAISITFIPEGKPGPQHQNVLVITNDPVHPRMWLRIRGTLSD